MKIQNFQLNNIGLFEQIECVVAPTETYSQQVTLFVGNNGAGKTTILKSIATALSWFVARLRSEKGSGSPIPEIVIANQAHSGRIELVLCDQLQHQDFTAASDDNPFILTLAKTKKGRVGKYATRLSDVAELANFYRQALSQDANYNLPLIAFYSVERVVLDVPLKIRHRHNFMQLDGYDNSLSQGVDFRRFFEWYREREDGENESSLPDEVLQQMQRIIKADESIWGQIKQLKQITRDRQLTAVRRAIEHFMPGFTNLRVRRKPRLHMSIDKHGATLDVLQLSQGEKSLLALIGDIARRLAMMNPSLDNPLLGEGIILIDEVDMHLHPRWQRSLIDRLTETFPNCQFLLSTHSPLLVSDTPKLLVYVVDDGKVTRLPDQYGQDANAVLLEVMDTDARNGAIQEQINDLYDAIHTGEIGIAEQRLSQLAQLISADHIELTKAAVLLRKRKLRHAKN
jgi:predicted ATP-binding protein involved in virulence